MLKSDANRGLTFVATVTRPDANGVDQPVDLTQVGVKLWFTAKRARGDLDAAAIVRKGYGVAGLAGIAANAPATAAKNKATVQVIPADTAALAESETLVWDLVLDDPSSGLGPETVDAGAWRVTFPVLRAP